MMCDMGADDDEDLRDLLRDRYVVLDTHFSWTRSAITIQCSIRNIRNSGILLPERHRLYLLRKSVIAIQCTKIQAAVRGYLLRHTIMMMGYTFAATMIQAAGRGYLVRHRIG